MGSDDSWYVSIITWNIWFGSREGWDYPERRWSDILEQVTSIHPDAIGFQECTVQFLDVVKIDPEFNKKYKAVNQAPKGYTYFVMLYVKIDLNILEHKTIRFKSNLDRRCESATIMKENLVFRIGTVHVESWITYPNIREEQVTTMFKELTNSSKQVDLILLFGDFNFHETDKENIVIDKSKFLDIWKVTHPNEDGFTFDCTTNKMTEYSLGSMNKGLTRTRIDRVLFHAPNKCLVHASDCKLLGTQSIFSSEEVDIFPSDHYGLFASFNKDTSIKKDKNKIKDAICTIL